MSNMQLKKKKNIIWEDISQLDLMSDEVKGAVHPKILTFCQILLSSQHLKQNIPSVLKIFTLIKRGIYIVL